MRRPWYAKPAEAVLRRMGRMAPAEPAPAFERRAPAVQNAVDLFKGQWACALSDVLPGVEAGRHHIFADGRPALAAEHLGSGGRLDGMSILELGPLEGAHSYLMQTLGAEAILAIEANATAFLKCLVVKEALGLDRVRFVLGDFSAYLREAPRRFDLIFACGVLYHMTDPLELIALIAGATDRCFVWTHYFDPARGPARTAHRGERQGFEAIYWRNDYGEKGNQFWGGVDGLANWMEKDAILEAFRRFGLDQVTVLEDTPDHPNGPAFTFVAQRG